METLWNNIDLMAKEIKDTSYGFHAEPFEDRTSQV